MCCGALLFVSSAFVAVASAQTSEDTGETTSKPVPAPKSTSATTGSEAGPPPAQLDPKSGTEPSSVSPTVVPTRDDAPAPTVGPDGEAVENTRGEQSPRKQAERGGVQQQDATEGTAAPEDPHETGDPGDATAKDSTSHATARSDAPATDGAAASATETSESTSYRNNTQSPRFLFLPRLGLTIGGWTNLQDTCDAKGSLSCGEFDVGDHSEASGLGVFMDGLVQIVPPLRVGLSAGWVPSAKGDAGTDLRRLGMEFSLQGVVEGVLPLSAEVGLTGRVSGGAAVLLTKGFSEDQIDQAIADCDAAIEAGISCFVDHNTPFSPVFGAGFGFSWRTTGVRLDFQYQLQKFTLYKQEASVDSSSIDAKVALAQSRFWLLGGIEF